MEVNVVETRRIEKVYKMAKQDSIAQSYRENLNLRVGPIGLVVRRDDFALDQPGHTVTPQIVLRHNVLVRLLAGRRRRQISMMTIFSFKKGD